MTGATSKRRLSLNEHLQQAGCANELRHLITDIARAGKYVHNAIRTTDLDLADTFNRYEQQLKLDVLSNNIIRDELHESRLVHSFCSEEEANVEPLADEGPFVVVFDPLDGSSLVDANLTIGSIFGIYPRREIFGATPGDQAAALYLVYGPRTILVYSIGNGVHQFHLNDVGEFVLMKANMMMRDEVLTYAPGNLRAVVDTPAYYKMMRLWLNEGLTLRYSGGMVPDIHHMLVKGGGIFTNIGGSHYPQGKLRLLFECGPFAYIMHHAGGACFDGERPIMDIPIKDIDQRTPIIIGSKKEVTRVCAVLKG